MTRSKLLLFIPVLLAFAVTVPITATAGLNIGVDVKFHLAIAESWRNGNVGMFSNVVMNENHFPYPPLFHFLLLPGEWAALFLQVVLLPLAVASFMLLAYKVLGFDAAFFGGLLLLGSTAFLDRVMQPQPQALDFILLPLAFLFFLQKKPRGYVAAAVLIVWTHGLVSVSALGGTLLLKIKQREWKSILAFLLGSSVILAVSFWYLLGGLGNYGPRIDTNQELYFWSDPFFVPSYLGLLAVGFFAGAWLLWKRNLSELTKLSLLTIATTAIMITVWPDRWIQYCTIPLALLTVEFMQRQTRWVKFGFKAVVCLAVVWMFDTLYFI